MKVVTCQKCGEKYQLNDEDDVNDYECNICTGDLIEETTTHTKNTKKSSNPDFKIVYCEECGLKYQLSLNDNIEDYECDSCGGNLKFIEEKLNKANEQSVEISQNNDLNDLKNDEINDNIKLNDLENENNINLDNIAQYQNSYTYPNNYEITLHTYYNELKQDLKKSYLQHILEVPNDKNLIDQLSNRVKGKIKSNDIDLNYSEINNEVTRNSRNDEDTIFGKYFENITKKELCIIIGTLITIIGLLSIILINIIYSIFILIIGIILLVYGFYEQKDNVETNTQTQKHIIRSKLLTLPKEYYVLYYVKLPGTNIGINHVVIGPTGIYTIFTKKNKSSEIKQKKLKSRFNSFENYFENKYDLNSEEDDEINFDNEFELKQKTLTLNRILLQFLNENSFAVPVEPLLGFVNNDVAIINDILNNNVLFMDEVLNMITSGDYILDNVTIRKIAILLSHYSINCPN